MAEVLFINGSFVKRNTQLNGSVDDNYAFPMIRLAQDKYVQIYLGTSLYEKLKTDIAADSLTGVYETLLNEHVRNVCLWWTMVEWLPRMHVRVDNGGLVVRTSEDSQPITRADLNRELDFARNNAQFYTNSMIRYLCDNSSSFPEYTNNTGDQIRPFKSAYYEAGMEIQGGRGYVDPIYRT